MKRRSIILFAVWRSDTCIDTNGMLLNFIGNRITLPFKFDMLPRIAHQSYGFLLCSGYSLTQSSRDRCKKILMFCGKVKIVV